MYPRTDACLCLGIFSPCCPLKRGVGYEWEMASKFGKQKLEKCLASRQAGPTRQEIKMVARIESMLFFLSRSSGEQRFDAYEDEMTMKFAFQRHKG
mmetsp:Transcript_23008/g.36959  ORF Transcript_23008/g.36959 Transcript_23008/m.36959 type:complete len:96 (+) Transcript_23008:402-689(+)